MSIVDRISELAHDKGVSISGIEKAVGLSNGIIGKWKKQSPSCDKLKLVADYLETTIDYLMTGNENTKFKKIDISNSNVGTIGNNLSGTFNIGNSNMTYGDNSNVNINNGYKEKLHLEQIETANEILRILNELPLKERSKLLTIIYDFEDEYISKNK